MPGDLRLGANFSDAVDLFSGHLEAEGDLDFFDDEGYEEEPYINEDEEPVIADDEDNGDETKETEETI